MGTTFTAANVLLRLMALGLGLVMLSEVMVLEGALYIRQWSSAVVRHCDC